MKSKFASSCFLWLFCFFCPLAFSNTASNLQNPSFEEGLYGWNVNVPSAELVLALPEAASYGAKGLRIRSSAKHPEFEISSTPVPVKSGADYIVEFWSSSGGDGPIDNVSVRVVFADKDGVGIALDSGLSNSYKPSTRVFAGRSVVRMTIGARAPRKAVSLSIKIQVARKAASGPVDLDDFSVRVRSTLSDSANVNGLGRIDHPEIVARQKSLEADIEARPFSSVRPLVVVLKLDDLGPDVQGKVPEAWLKVVEYARLRRIKVSFGVIAEWVKGDSDVFLQWVKARHSEGMVEFWNHGWDHRSRVDTDSGKVVKEFQGESYLRQKKHLNDANQLAREKFGFSFASFGAPFNATDENTVKALSEDGDIKIWLYGNSRNSAGKKVLPGGVVGLEYPGVGVSYSDFLEHFSHNRKERLLVLQGHPRNWNEIQWADFLKIVDFLIGRGADFRLPRDFLQSNISGVPAD